MMALQKERGVNPLAGCLPLLPQIPVFLSLFHVLRRLAPGVRGPLQLVRRAHRPGGARRAVRGADLGVVQHDRRQGEAILAIAGTYRHPHRLRRPDRDHVHHDLHHAEADHEALGPGRGPGRDGAEAAALRHADEPVRLGLLLPDRRPALLDDQQPVDPRPAVLHPAQDAAARLAPPRWPRPPPTSPPSTRRRSPRSRAPSRSARSRPPGHRRRRRRRRRPTTSTARHRRTPRRRPTALPGRAPRRPRRAAGPRADRRPRRPGPATGASASAADRAPRLRPAPDRPTDHRARPAARTDLEEPP